MRIYLPEKIIFTETARVDKPYDTEMEVNNCFVI